MAKKKLTSQLVRVFAANVRRIREGLDISQEKLAEMANLHRTYIGSIERAERNVSLLNVERIARALKVSPCDLICSDNDERKR